MTQTIVFTSDIHLSPNRPDLLALFETFIKEHASKATDVYLLGDLFEAWIGDDNLTKFNRHVAGLIKSLAKYDIKTYFMHGNRDFLLGQQYADLCQMSIIPDPFLLEHEDSRALLSHGDIFCTKDVNYQEFRERMRDPKTMAKILSLPLFVRKALAWYLRTKSHRQMRKTPIERMDDFDADLTSVLKCLKQFEANIAIHGHTHIPGIDFFADTQQQRIRRFVLSDWEDKGNYILWEHNRPLVHCYFK